MTKKSPQRRDNLNHIENKRHVWPFDTAVTIAGLSLVLSVFQFIVTNPLLMGFYFKSKVVVSRFSLPDKDVGFYVENTGQSEAKEVEVFVTALETDKVSVIPDFNATITQNESVFLRTYKVSVPRLNSKEGYRIIVKRLPESLVWIPSNVTYPVKGVARIGPIPFVGRVRTESGTTLNLATASDVASSFIEDQTSLKKEK